MAKFKVVLFENIF